MRIAIVSDIHGNRTAFEAVLADLRQTSPDLILHGGDLADSGASPVEIVDHIRDLGWQGCRSLSLQSEPRVAVAAWTRRSPVPTRVLRLVEYKLWARLHKQN